MIPTVAIVGKPNVGKSSLFNRLIRQRKAIVSEEPGVTRDINYETVFWEGVHFRLADTAGYLRSKDDIHSITRKLNNRLIEEVDVIIFTCDVMSLSAEDHDLAEVVRKSGKPVILVVNKIDNDERLKQYYDFFELGFEDPIPLSALHGRNIQPLIERIASFVSRIIQSGRGSGHIATADTEPEVYQGSIEREIDTGGGFSEETGAGKAVSVAIVGRPNVGKSSLLNLVVGKNRSIVMETPGTTRDAVDETMVFGGHTVKFIDTAGLRKRQKVSGNIEFYSLLRARMAIESSHLAVLVIDACEGITRQDKKIASIIVENKKGLVIASNKWDIAQGLYRNEKEFISKLYADFPHIDFADTVVVSAKTGYNKIKLLKNIIKVYNNYHKAVKTSELNGLIRELRAYRHDVKYAIQRGISPPRFEFFVRKSEQRNDNLKKFLQNSIRAAYDFRGVPLDVNLRAK